MLLAASPGQLWKQLSVHKALGQSDDHLSWHLKWRQSRIPAPCTNEEGAYIAMDTFMQAQAEMILQVTSQWTPAHKHKWCEVSGLGTFETDTSIAMADKHDLPPHHINAQCSNTVG
jgi:hypothetical protein